MTAGRASASLALAAYAESWISGARVIVFGSAASPLAESLIDRGARLVQVYDPDQTRVAEATARGSSAQIGYAPLEQAGVSGRDGAFDFGIVEDLSLPGADPAKVLHALSRTLSRRGLALVASPNGDVERRLIELDTRAETLGYYELYDVVSEHFAEVRMLGQTPFVGYAVADFAAGDDGDVRLDTAFLPSGAEEPEWFLALVSESPSAAESFAVIQLPFDEVTPRRRAGAGRDARLSREASNRLVELEAELAKREEWLSSLEERAATADKRADEAQAEAERLQEQTSRKSSATDKKLERALAEARELRTKVEHAERDRHEAARKLGDESSARNALDDAITALQTELATSRRQCSKLEGEAASLAEQKKSLEARAGQLEARLSDAERLRQEAERTHRSELAELASRAEKAAQAGRTELAELASRADKAEQASRAAEAKRASRADDTGEIDALEAQLRERAREIARLEREVRKTERFGRQLIRQLAELQTVAPEGASEEQIAELSERNALLEADLEAARWTISTLEQSPLEGEESGASRAERDSGPGGSATAPGPSTG